MIEIKNGVIYVDEVATTNPELIGLAMLDLVEEKAVALLVTEKANEADLAEIFPKWPKVKIILHEIPKSDFDDNPNTQTCIIPKKNYVTAKKHNNTK